MYLSPWSWAPSLHSLYINWLVEWMNVAILYMSTFVDLFWTSWKSFKILVMNLVLAVSSSDPDVGLRALESPGTWYRSLIYVRKLVLPPTLQIYFKIRVYGYFSCLCCDQDRTSLTFNPAMGAWSYGIQAADLNSALRLSVFYESRHCKLLPALDRMHTLHFLTAPLWSTQRFL